MSGSYVPVTTAFGYLPRPRESSRRDRALASIPRASLQYHVVRGDFYRWARDVLGDADLATGLAKPARR